MFWGVIVQNFEMSLDPNTTSKEIEEALEGTEGIVHGPGQHKIVFKSY